MHPFLEPAISRLTWLTLIEAETASPQAPQVKLIAVFGIRIVIHFAVAVDHQILQMESAHQIQLLYTAAAFLIYDTQLVDSRSLLGMCRVIHEGTVMIAKKYFSS